MRLRAAEGLVDLKAELVQIFEKVVALHDQYGLHAYLTALENAGLQPKMEAEIKAIAIRETIEMSLEVLRTGRVSTTSNTPLENIAAKAAAGS